MIVSTPKLYSAGIGNLLFPLSKAYLASIALNCRLLIPFQIDTIRFKIYFNPFKIGYLPYFPNPFKKIRYTKNEYDASRKYTHTDDYYTNIRYYVKKNKLKNIVLVNEGMWGGYRSILRARKWIKTILASSKNARKTISEMDARFSPNKIQIGFHIRRGDFKKGNALKEITETQWNTQIPIDWYADIADRLVKHLGKNYIELIIFTDSPNHQEIKYLRKEHEFIVQQPRKGNVYSDLFLMSECDLLICSNSSFSMMGAFLSDSPYVMYEEYIKQDRGQYTLWDDWPINDNEQIQNQRYRGYVYGRKCGIDQSMLSDLENKIQTRNSYNSELIYGGKVTCPRNIQ